MIPATTTTIPVDRGAVVELTLSVDLEEGSDRGLLRALTALHRRHCRVLEARFDAGRAGIDRLVVRVEAPPRHAHCVASWLSALVEVRMVAASGCEGSTP